VQQKRPTPERLKEMRNNMCGGPCDACKEHRDLFTEIDGLRAELKLAREWEINWIEERDKLKAENEKLHDFKAALKEGKLILENQKLRERIEKLREPLLFIIENKNQAFAECSIAEEIWSRCKKALSQDDKERG
jgi:hypothetical protein